MRLCGLWVYVGAGVHACDLWLIKRRYEVEAVAGRGMRVGGEEGAGGGRSQLTSHLYKHPRV